MIRIILAVLLFSMVLPAGIHAAGQADCEAAAKILNSKFESENGLCKGEIVRKNIQATHMGYKLSPETMDLAFQFNFEKVEGKTAVMGELALLQEEVNPVIDELRKGNLEVTAVHNHMLYEEPRIIYVHFHGEGDITKQAKTIKNAIDKTSK